jgi:hypothetical protein
MKQWKENMKNIKSSLEASSYGRRIIEFLEYF